MDKIKFTIVSEDDYDYTIGITRPDGVYIGVLIPKGDIPDGATYGLNLVHGGHYE